MVDEVDGDRSVLNHNGEYCSLEIYGTRNQTCGIVRVPQSSLSCIQFRTEQELRKVCGLRQAMVDLHSQMAIQYHRRIACSKRSGVKMSCRWSIAVSAAVWFASSVVVAEDWRLVFAQYRRSLH